MRRKQESAIYKQDEQGGVGVGGFITDNEAAFVLRQREEVDER